MAPVVRIFEKFRASDGRIKVATLSGVSGLVIALALLMGVFPAFAEHDPADGPEVPPIKIEYGGGSGACDAIFTGLPSAAEHELWINNPMTGKFRGPDGTEISIIKNGNFFNFVAPPGIGVFDAIVNGGSHNNHFDYDDRGDGPVTHDDGLHAPRKGGPGSPPHNLSHINLCYEELPPGSVSGVKYHDHDADGQQDNSTDEAGLGGWTIAAFDNNGDLAGTDVTGSDGSYTIADLAPVTYTICEQINSAGLPSPVPAGVTWSWTQSDLEDSTWGADCDQFNPTEGPDVYLPVGHTVTIEADVSGVDFGNHRQATIDCSATEGAIELSLGGGNEPLATVTFPADCESGEGENPVFTTSFDLGLSTDSSDDWTQFVVFGGDPTSTQVLTQTIVWASEPSNYVEGQLVVPTTQVLLDLTGTLLQDVRFCHDIDGGGPTQAIPQCLDSRTIAETAPSDPEADYLTDIQLTEVYKVLGDPGNFR